jgi:hypothetical protein
MPTIAFVVNRTGERLGTRVVQWPALAAGDDGAALELPEMSDRSVHVRGTFGGTTITIQGSNEAVPTSWVTLTSANGSPLVFSADGLRQVTEVTRWIRPLSAGGTGVAVTVEMIAQ